MIRSRVGSITGLMCAAIFLTLLGEPAHAACTASSSGVAFGTYDYTNGNAATGTVTLSCTSSTVMSTVRVALSIGTTAGATIANRLMAQTAPVGADKLKYGLYQNSTNGPACAGGTNWGNTIATEPAAIASLTVAPGTPHSWTVFGCSPSAQDINVAGYTDTVTVTISWN